MIGSDYMKIDSIDLKVIADSKGKDTLEARLEGGGISVTASVPAGESTGKNEARIVDPKKALEKVNWVFLQIKDHEFNSLEQFDCLLNTLDGTKNKTSLGANLILSLSLSFTKLLAQKNGMETWELISKISGSKPALPLCLFNVIEGGAHARDSLPFQEHWFIPKTHSPKQALAEVFRVLDVLDKKIKQEFGEVNMGSEGGYIIPSKGTLDGLNLLVKAIKETGAGVYLGLDCAASTFFEQGKYRLEKKLISSGELLQIYKKIVDDYSILAIEDPFSEEDWEGFMQMTKALGERIWVVADDLTTTNSAVIKKAAETKAANAVIIKTTQIGTVTETIQAANLAKSYGWKIIVANRGEETMDDFIADLAVGLGADAIKSGCPLQKERLVKYERLAEIERTWHI